MKTYIALFRGINVGGNNILPMKELKALLESLKLQNVRTYIQSGNVLFQCEEQNKTSITKKISNAIENSHGFKPQVLLLATEELAGAISNNPFPEAETEPKTLHLFFLVSAAIKPNFEKLDNSKSETEQYKLVGSVFYLHAPDGIGRSKLAVKVEKSLGVSATGRNWRTVQKIMEMSKKNS